MKNAIVVTALAGLASAAIADSLTVSVQFDETVVAIGQTVTVTVMASFTVDSGEGYLGVVNFALDGDDSLATASNLQWGTFNNAGAQTGSTSGADILDFKMGQTAIFGPTDNSSPIMIMSFTLTTLSEGFMTYSGQAGSPFSFGVFDTADGNFGLPTEYGIEVIQSQTVLFVPASPALPLLGLSGLVAIRRRR